MTNRMIFVDDHLSIGVGRLMHRLIRGGCEELAPRDAFAGVYGEALLEQVFDGLGDKLLHFEDVGLGVLDDFEEF